MESSQRAITPPLPRNQHFLSELPHFVPASSWSPRWYSLRDQPDADICRSSPWPACGPLGAESSLLSSGPSVSWLGGSLAGYLPRPGRRRLRACHAIACPQEPVRGRCKSPVHVSRPFPDYVVYFGALQHVGAVPTPPCRVLRDLPPRPPWSGNPLHICCLATPPARQILTTLLYIRTCGSFRHSSNDTNRECRLS